ncbi:MAG: cytidylyltransferase family protein [Hyphomicrobiales bacterium]|nr:cytidylyltransferase family protein [Hyphomicrobiales bacterium]
MKFGPVQLEMAEGGILAHSVKRDGLVLKKGTVLTHEHVTALRYAGLGDVVVAQLEQGDIGEDHAAAMLADAIAGEQVRVDPAFTGRANLFATCAGVLVVEPSLVDAVNAVDEQVTLATLPPFCTVVEGEMIATVKVIPFAVPQRIVEAAIASAHGERLRVAAFAPLRLGIVSTLLPGLKPSTVDKTLRVMRERIAPARASIARELRVPHETTALVAALEEIQVEADLIIVFGASAITDRRDVIPAALTAAGGRIEHFGMPVDPGNLLLIGELGGKPVLGAPGCARSPKENGFDWVLHRMLARLPVRSADIRRMGSGGLLMEIVSRPQPRLGGNDADVMADE